MLGTDTNQGRPAGDVTAPRAALCVPLRAAALPAFIHIYKCVFIHIHKDSNTGETLWPLWCGAEGESQSSSNSLFPSK